MPTLNSNLYIYYLITNLKNYFSFPQKCYIMYAKREDDINMAYNFKEIEKKWQNKWYTEGTFNAENNFEKKKRSEERRVGKECRL